MLTNELLKIEVKELMIKQKIVSNTEPIMFTSVDEPAIEQKMKVDKPKKSQSEQNKPENMRTMKTKKTERSHEKMSENTKGFVDSKEQINAERHLDKQGSLCIKTEN
eukprot:15259642-Ditylum_brightwellii.AAC.2